MDFFEKQDKARGKTKLLIFYYCLAMFTMILVIYVVFAVMLNLSNDGKSEPGISEPDTLTWLHPEVLGIVALGVGAVVGLGSLYKVAELRGGGDKVASMLGGRRIAMNTSDPHEKVVMNVVEEMALASGVPVPPVYVLDHEPGINAFAAGYSPNDAVIGVNRGTIETLNRAELQGVIAHEFSHVLNGDMRINIRLIGILFGIQVLAILGYYMFRFAGAASAGRSSKKGNPALFIFIAGLVVMIVGFVGQICARMIQAAISRQREYLADASAVQFTRDPNTIGGALKVIGAHADGTRIKHPSASQASHMFFAEGVKMNFGGLATHPPLLDRIKKIDPNFDGNYEGYLQRRYSRAVGSKSKSQSKSKATSEQEAQRAMDMLQKLPVPGLGGDGFGPMGEMTNAMPGGDLMLNPAMMIAGVGMLDEDQVTHSQEVLERITPQIQTAIHDSFSARCVIYALLLDDDQAIRSKQLETIQQAEGESTVEETTRLQKHVDSLPQDQRLPCLEIIQGTLSQLSPEQYRRFGYSVIELVKADQKIDLFEFILQHLLLTHLDRRFGFRPAAQVKFKNLTQVKAEIELILAVLVYVGHDDETETINAFRQAAKSFGDKVPLELLPKDKCNFQQLDKALDKVNQASPALKKQVLHAAATAVAADGKITVEEAELFRAFAESIECPVPPIMATENEA